MGRATLGYRTRPKGKQSDKYIYVAAGGAESDESIEKKGRSSKSA